MFGKSPNTHNDFSKCKDIFKIILCFCLSHKGFLSCPQLGPNDDKTRTRSSRLRRDTSFDDYDLDADVREDVSKMFCIGSLSDDTGSLPHAASSPQNSEICEVIGFAQSASPQSVNDALLLDRSTQTDCSFSLGDCSLMSVHEFATTVAGSSSLCLANTDRDRRFNEVVRNNLERYPLNYDIQRRRRSASRRLSSCPLADFPITQSVAVQMPERRQMSAVVAVSFTNRSFLSCMRESSGDDSLCLAETEGTDDESSTNIEPADIQSESESTTTEDNGSTTAAVMQGNSLPALVETSWTSMPDCCDKVVIESEIKIEQPCLHECRGEQRFFCCL